jgi:hypothetical protein
MRQQTDFSESGWTGPGMMEPMMPSTPVQPSTPSPSPMMGERSMAARKPKRPAVRKRKKAARPKAKKKAKRTRPKAKAKRAKAKRKPARRRR